MLAEPLRQFGTPGERERRVHQALNELLQRAFHPEFTGTVSLELNVKKGGLMDLHKVTRERG